MNQQPDHPASADSAKQPRPTRLKAWPYLAEVAVVLWVSLGASALRAAVSLLDRLTVGVPLADQSTSLVVSRTPDRPWLDLTYQLLSVFIGLGAVALVCYLLVRSGDGLRSIGLDRTEPGRDWLRGTLLAVGVGGVGLGFYLFAYNLGISVSIAAVTAVEFWWTIPMLLLKALQNAALEEIVILGYALHRMWQAGLGTWSAISISALIRGTYHLYQGFGGFVGNLVMGLLFGWLFSRWQRTWPFVVAHFLIDAAAFVGYLLLRDTVGWLP